MMLCSISAFKLSMARKDDGHSTMYKLKALVSYLYFEIKSDFKTSTPEYHLDNYPPPPRTAIGTRTSRPTPTVR